MTNRHKKIDVAMIGARMHYAVPRILHEAGLLNYFYTDSYIGNKPWIKFFLKLIPNKLTPRIVQRYLSREDVVIPPNKVISFEFLGIWYAWSRSRVKSHKETLRLYRKMEYKFSKSALSNGLGAAPVVWVFTGASVQIFKAAKKEKKVCILEQFILPSDPQRRLINQEKDLWPDWQPNLQNNELDEIKSEQERISWKLADYIVAGSDFVRDGLKECDVPEEKIFVIPYGVDTKRFSPKSRSILRKTDPIKVLFVGEVGLRKGVPYLLEALLLLGKNVVQAKFAGEVAVNNDMLEPYSHVVEFKGVVPRQKVRELYEWADLFVLPSIVEGSATVTYEALLSGLPVITTQNAGSIVEDNVNGFIVPIRDISAIKDKVYFYYKNKDILLKHQTSCNQNTYLASYDRYKKDIVKMIDGI